MLEQTEVDGITVVTLAHGKVNVLDVEAFDALTDLAAELTGSAAVVLTGAGSAFSAGADLRRLMAEGAPFAAQLLTSMTRAYTAWFDLPVPVVAAVNGHAIAGGCVLAGVADHRVMSAGRIGLTELAVGVPFPPAPFEVMRHLLGDTFRTVVMDADLHEVDDALRLGLIDEIATPETLMDAALERARTYAGIPPSTYAVTKRALRAPARARWSLDDDLSALADLWSQPELLDRVAAQFAAR